MNTKEVTAIAIKLLALWLLIQVILYIPSLILIINTFGEINQNKVQLEFYVSVVLTFLVIGTVASFVLFRVSSSVLNKIPATTETKHDGLSQQFILQVAGTFFIVSALSTLLSYSTVLLRDEDFNISNYFYVSGILLEFVIGAHLLVSSIIWVRWFNYLRGRT